MLNIIDMYIERHGLLTETFMVQNKLNITVKK